MVHTPADAAHSELSARRARGRGRLAVHLPGIALAAFAATIVPLVSLIVAAATHRSGMANDFSSYWLAGRLVASGSNPYDLGALAALAQREHVSFLLGTGYSYPPPFALAIVPLSRLPLPVALAVFQATSMAVFALAAAVWAIQVATVWPALDAAGHPIGAARRRRTAALLAFAAGAYPPIVGSLYFGQVNLLVFGVLALGLYPWLARPSPPGQPPEEVSETPGGIRGGARARRELGAGFFLAVAGLVKLVPFVLVVPLVLSRRWSAVAGMIAATAAGTAAAALMAPRALAGSGQLSDLFAADGFWSNQSTNGFATRLVDSTDRTVPLAPHLVGAGTLGAALAGLIALATLVALLSASREREEPTERAVPPGLIFALALALVAGLIGAPKDSFWNHTPALLAVGLLLAAAGRAGEGWPLRDGHCGWLAAWYGLAWLQAIVDLTGGTLPRALGGPGSVLASAGVFGLVVLWGLLVARIRQKRRLADTDPRKHGLILRP